jgi:predicted DNA-binding transcriptional regulator AlpA
MHEDRLIRRKEIYSYINIKDTKLRELIDNNLFVKPISVPGFNEKLYSINEIQEYIEKLKAARNEIK